MRYFHTSINELYKLITAGNIHLTFLLYYIIKKLNTQNHRHKVCDFCILKKCISLRKNFQ
jgi:hypothetical protein